MTEHAPAPPPGGEPIGTEQAAERVPETAAPTFASLNLGPEVLRALGDMGFAEPMQVQTAVVPLVLTGRDLMVQSRTGSGKTAAFGIPLVDRIVNPEGGFVQAIVLLPTRELALQVAGEVARIAAYRPIEVVPVYGGAPMGRQIEQLRAGGQIVCGTPGRVLDHIRRGTLQLDRVRCVVLDECDEMLSMGFQEDIEAIVDRTPSERQTLLFSATVPEGIQRLARRFLRDPEMVKLSADFVGVHEIRHVYYAIPGGQRESELLRVLEFESPKRAIIFCNTREETGRVAEFLRRHGYEAEAISSDLSQVDREKVMAKMRAGTLHFLVATDVAARGIDLEAITHVINYTFPESPEVYIHRTGRTGRAGKHGTAISLIGPTEVGPFYYVKLLYKIRPEERSLPSEAEIRAKREGERIQALRARLPREPGAHWRSLARRLMSALDGEQLCASLLAETFEREPVAEVARPEPPPLEPTATATSTSTSTSERSGGGYGTSERSGGYGTSERSGGYRSREREGGKGPFKPRGDRPGRERFKEERDRGRRPRSEASGDRPPVREERVRRERRPAEEPPRRPADETVRRPAEEPPRRPADETVRRSAEETVRRSAEEPPRVRPPEREDRPTRSPATPNDRDYWSVWGDDGSSAPVVSEEPAAATPETAFAERSAGPGPDQARLFLNLGRKDDATAEEVAAIFGDLGVTVPPGDIEVMNTHSYINVPAGEAERLCMALSGRDRQGRKLSCEPARPRRR